MSIYFPSMPVDVLAEVITNARLSHDYNVLALAAPEIGRIAQPGQFVMVKPAPGLDPLLRRPFSIFEILRTPSGEVKGISILNKSVGQGTRLLYEATETVPISVLGPLGRPFVPIDPPGEAWMVAGGVGLAPFVTLAEALRERGTRMTLFYGGRSSRDLYYTSFFEELGADLVLTTEDGTKGEEGRVTVPLIRALDRRVPGTPVTIYACGPTPMMRAVSDLGTQSGVPVFVSLEPVMGCGMGGCYSCVVRVTRDGGSHFVRSCIDGPVFDGSRLVWDGMTGH